MDETKNVVNDEELTPSPATEATQQEEIVPEETNSPAPGSKTESELLLKSLQDEREKRRELEARAKELEEENQIIKSSTNSDEVYSDEGKALKKELDSIKGTLSSLKDERELERIYAQYPLLKEKAKDFEEYRSQEHPRAKIESVAKLYLVENGLLETKRKGLESPTGGSRTPMSAGMTSEEVKHLRETNYRRYLELLKKDQIKIG